MARTGDARRTVVVVGAGIVGISVARALARRGVDVTVLERDHQVPRGSTAFAPGFVGLYNDVPVLTRLARESAQVYDGVVGGFRRSGGVELATSDRGVVELVRRVEAARAVGLQAALLAPADLPAPVAAIVESREVLAAALFPEDGSADLQILTRSLRTEAESSGARFLGGREVVGVDRWGSALRVASAQGERQFADDVVLAGGVWGPALAALVGLDLPLFPVAHPYVYGPSSASLVPGPFVRWPEHHVYARVHGDRLGLGSYDHQPVPVGLDQLTAGAGLRWRDDFGSVIERAQRLLRPPVRFAPEHRVNGVFAMTPDNLPFLGRHPETDGVWVAQALWVTNAAGAAGLLAEALVAETSLPRELDVVRFDGADPDALRGRALRLYRDIYANDVV